MEQEKLIVIGLRSRVESASRFRAHRDAQMEYIISIRQQELEKLKVQVTSLERVKSNME